MASQGVISKTEQVCLEQADGDGDETDFEHFSLRDLFTALSDQHARPLEALKISMTNMKAHSRPENRPEKVFAIRTRFKST